MTLLEAHPREADPGLAADRARPRALHPLLPLHALLLRRRRGRPARSRATAARTPRSRPSATTRTARPSPATSSSSAPSARSPRRSTASRRGPGRSRTCPPSAASAPSAATSRVTTREGKVKRVLSREPPGDRRRLALRQGPLRVPAPGTPRTGSPSRSSAARARSRAGLVGRRRSTRPRSCSAARRRPDRHRALRLRDDRAGLRARPAPADRSRRPLRGAARVDLVGARRVPAAALDDRRGGAGRRRRRRRRRRPRPDRRPLAEAGGPQRRRDRDGRADRRRATSAGRRRRPRSGPSRSRGTSSARGCAPPSARS